MKKLIILLLIIKSTIFAQSFGVNKIEPPNWWEGIKWDTLQLMIYGEGLSDVKVTSENLNIIGIHHAESPSYLFVDINTEELKAGNYSLTFKKDGKSIVKKYRVDKREFSPRSHKGFDQNDVIYLIFTDRFADGDLKNDSIQNKYEEFAFGDLNGRHGGDLKGIIDHLDYLADLGITAIWHTPVLENNMYMSYHGYAATNFYKIDPRFGSNELYKKMVSAAHSKGIKVISDHVNNHLGKNHPWGSEPPFKDWFHGDIKIHPKAYHNKIAFFDIHADNSTANRSVEGWFTDYMMDLNKDNNFVANYMIQNTLWWIEYSGIDGIREDTYPYNELDYMAKWAKVIFDNYPDFNIVGEVWKGDPAFLSEYQKNPKIDRGFDSNLPTITDFALYESVRDYLSGKGGMWKIYETLAKDFLYSNPYQLMTFIDNHDVDRALYTANDNVDKYLNAITILLTSRGIPQITYGTEIGMNGGGHHGRIRAPFPGGFPEDKKNAFNQKDRSDKENRIFNHVKKLLELRNEKAALRVGKLIHFPPESEVYVYFRTLEEQKIMIIINGAESNREIFLNKYLSQFGNVKHLIDLSTNKKIFLNGTNEIVIPSNSSMILELIY